MGNVSWPPPLPETATREEVLADLAALRAEIRRNNLSLALVFGSVPVLAAAFLLMWVAA